MLKGPKLFLVALGPKTPLYTYVFAFYCIFMLKLAQNFIFSAKKRQIFLNRRLRRQNFGHFAPKVLPPNPKLMEGAETLDLAMFGGGGLAPLAPPLIGRH